MIRVRSKPCPRKISEDYKILPQRLRDDARLKYYADSGFTTLVCRTIGAHNMITFLSPVKVSLVGNLLSWNDPWSDT